VFVTFKTNETLPMEIQSISHIEDVLGKRVIMSSLDPQKRTKYYFGKDLGQGITI
jgi:hypothetical protein